MLHMKRIIRVYPVLETLPRSAPSSPPWPIKPQKGKRRGKQKINLSSPSKTLLNLHPRKDLSASPNILVLSMTRITTPKIARSDPRLDDYRRVLPQPLLCSKNTSPLSKRKWWSIRHHPLLHLALKSLWSGQSLSTSRLEQKNIRHTPRKRLRFPLALLHPVLVPSTSSDLLRRCPSSPLQKV